MAYQKTGGFLTVNGIDTSKPAEYLAPENTPNAINMRVNRNIIRKREGTTELGASAYIDSYDVLVLQGVGIDASTTIVDSEFTPKTVTAVGGAQIDTAQFKFWSSSILFDGTNDHLTVPDSVNFSFGAGDFSIRGWFRFADLTGDQVIAAQYADANNYWFIKKLNTSNKFQIQFVIGGVTMGDYVMTSNWAGAINTWYWIEFVRSTTTALIYIGGVSQTLTATTAFATNNVGDVVSTLFVGQDGNSAGFFNGWMTDLVISKGIARASSVPTEGYKGHVFNEYVMGGRYLIREGVGYNIRVGPSKIQKYNTVNSTWENIQDALLTATNSDPVDFATPLLTGKRILVITNFIDNIKKYSGGSVTANLGGSPPLCKFMQDYRDYLVLGYIQSGGTFPTKLQWCDTANPEEWSAGNAGNKDLNEDNEDLTGLALFGEYVAAHKNSSIYLGYLVSTSAVFQFDRKNTGAGAVNYATIQNLPTANQAFLSLDGIRLFNGISAPIIEDPVTDELRETMNFQYIKRSWSLVIQELDEYWCGVPIGSSQVGDSVYKYNYKTGSVHKDVRTNAISAWKYSNAIDLTWDDVLTDWDSYNERWDSNSLGVSSLIPLVGDTSGQTAYRDTTTNNDLDVAIDAIWETKDFEADAKGMFGRWLMMEFWAKGNSVTIDYSIDGGQTWNSASSVTLNSDYPSDDTPDIYYFDTASTKVRFRFRNNTLGESFFLKQFVLSYKPREMRK